jgi:dTDP-4-dehydrorhamnose reductase
VERLTDSKGSYKLVNDHIWMPTYAGDMARTVWQLSNEDHEIYNVASPERATLYEFGLKVCDVFNLEKNLIKPIESDYFPTIAPRPKDTTYDLVKLTGQGIVLSDIKTTEHENKLAEILSVLTFFQCITFLFMSFLGMSVQDAHSKLRKIEDRNEL